MAHLLAGELGVYGHKPQVLNDILAGGFDRGWRLRFDRGLTRFDRYSVKDLTVLDCL